MLFERSGEAEQRGDVSYEFSLSILEIYNESIRDLLAASQSTADNLRIVQGKNGTQIVDLTFALSFSFILCHPWVFSLNSFLSCQPASTMSNLWKRFNLQSFFYSTKFGLTSFLLCRSCVI
jgi:hypothetical protein